MAPVTGEDAREDAEDALDNDRDIRYSLSGIGKVCGVCASLAGVTASPGNMPRSCRPAEFFGVKVSVGTLRWISIG